MNDRYWYFRKLLGFVEDAYDVVAANMSNFEENIVIKGRNEEGGTICVTVSLEEERHGTEEVR